MVQHLHFLVRERVHRDQDGILVQTTDDPLGITTFAYIKDPPTYMSMPSAKEGWLDTIVYAFEPLTQAQFESYIEMNLFTVLDSDKFVVPKDP